MSDRDLGLMWTTMDVVLFTLIGVAHTLVAVTFVALGTGATEVLMASSIAACAVSLISIVICIVGFVTTRCD